MAFCADNHAVLNTAARMQPQRNSARRSRNFQRLEKTGNGNSNDWKFWPARLFSAVEI
jgi:hypothetical protein